MSDTPISGQLIQQFGGDREAAQRFLEEMREENERARQRAEQRRKDEAAAQATKLQAQREAANAERVAQFKVSAAAVWPGDSKSFEAAFPRLLAEWQQRTALSAISDEAELIARKRASGIY